MNKRRSNDETMLNQEHQRTHLIEPIDNPLCLCEYYNKNNQRVHLLMCCCNCEAFDTLCTSLLCCDDANTDHINKLPDPKRSRLGNFIHSKKYLVLEVLNDVHDRLRLPYPGGAIKINPDFIISLVGLFFYVVFGTINFLSSILTIFIVPMLIYLRFISLRISLANSSSSSSGPSMIGIVNKNNSQSSKVQIKLAFYMILNCFVILFIWYLNGFAYELKSVMSDLENLLIQGCLLVSILFLIYLKRSNPGRAKPLNLDAAYIKNDSTIFCSKCNLMKDSQETGHCPVCEKCIFKRDHHCFWIDNCVGYLNHKAFVFFLVFLLAFFGYSFGIIFRRLSSLNCKLSVLWYTSNESIKDENSFSCLFDVYYSNYNRAMLTLLFIQLIPIMAYLVMLLAQQFIFISLGLTQNQLHKLSKKDVRFSLALFINKNFNLKTSYKNCFYFLKRSRKESDLDTILLMNNSSYDHLI